jgi:hypothetical protein
MLWLLLLPTAVGFIGAASNQLVLFANDDKFPVMVNQKHLSTFTDEGADANGMIDAIHCVMTHQTHLNILADIIDFHSTIVSIGDLLMDWSAEYGVFAYVIWGVLVIRKLWA